MVAIDALLRPALLSRGFSGHVSGQRAMEHHGRRLQRLERCDRHQRKKSISVQGLYTKPDKITASVLDFGGAERPTGAPEGEPWRNLFDSHITVALTPRLSVQAHADAGFENTTFGRASWRGGAVVARIKTNSWLYLAGRADVLDETVPTSAAGSASPLFFPAKRVRVRSPRHSMRGRRITCRHGWSSAATRHPLPIFILERGRHAAREIAIDADVRRHRVVLRRTAGPERWDARAAVLRTVAC